MDITFKEPEMEPRFQAEIYRARKDELEEYRVVIGREGTEVPPKIGKFIDYHAISDFTNRQGIEAWVIQQVQSLKKVGKRVVFDESPSYIISRAVEELANRSQPRMPLKVIFQVGMN